MGYPSTLPKADVIVYDADLAGTSYGAPAGANGFGAQATFDIMGDGQDDQGLRVTIARGAGREAIASDGYAVSFVVGAAGVTVNHAARTIVVAMPDDSALSLFKSTIDGDAALSSAYFGGETGSSTVADASSLEARESGGGTPDVACYFRLMLDGDGHLYVGAAAPANDSGSRFVPGNVPVDGMIPPGEQAWLSAVGATAVDGSIEVWPHR